MAVDPLPDRVATLDLHIPAVVEAVSEIAVGHVLGETLNPVFEVTGHETAIRDVHEVLERCIEFFS